MSNSAYINLLEHTLNRTVWYTWWFQGSSLNLLTYKVQTKWLSNVWVGKLFNDIKMWKFYLNNLFGETHVYISHIAWYTYNFLCKPAVFVWVLSKKNIKSELYTHKGNEIDNDLLVPLKKTVRKKFCKCVKTSKVEIKSLTRIWE